MKCDDLENINYKSYPFINTMKYFGFNIEYFNNSLNNLYKIINNDVDYYDCDNFLIISDKSELLDSYKKLLYH